MASAERAPLLTFHPQNDAFPGPQFVIPTSEVFGQDNDHGWIDEPGSPLLFWLRKNSETAVVFLIDRAEVAAAIDRWIIAWSEQPFSAVRNDGGADRLLGSREQALASVGETNSAHPDLVLSLEDRFGAWQLASWDRLDRRVHYSLPILAASAILALSVGLLAMLVSLQQRRALALAAQRVSFVNRVSHELRSPLTNILLNVDLAAEDIEDLSADGLGRLELVQEEARRLGRLIDNVLSFSRSEQARLRIEPRLCSPSIVLEAVLAQFRPAFRRRGLEIRSSADALPPCLLDGDALAQILANLLSNAEKYVRNGGVEVTCTHREDQLLVVVSDTGPGIPAGESERIFQPFERLDIQVTEGVSGTGLGLAISRDLAGRMGGSLRLLPSVRGAAFELRIPAPLADPLRSISAA
jgi:signal transduction histidine kinase